MQRLRARHDAVLSSAETVLADGASSPCAGTSCPLGQAVYPKETLRQPLRVIVDSQNRLTPGSAPVPEREPGTAGPPQGIR